MPFFSSISTRSRVVWIALAALALAFLTCPAWNLFYHPTIDGSLQWVFNYFADGHYKPGQRTLFPHGPLAFLLYPVPMGNNLIAALLLHLVCVIILVFQVYRLNRLCGKRHPLLLLAQLFFFLMVSDLLLLLIALTALHLMLYHVERKFKWLLFALVLVVFSLLVKTYSGVIGGLMLAFMLVYRFVQDRKPGILLWGSFGGLLILCAGWLSLYGDLQGLPQFLRAQLELSLDNSEAVQYAFENNWWLLSISFLALAFTWFVLPEKNARVAYGMMALPLFAAWKHAMGRVEAFHMAGFLYFLLLFMFLLWIISTKYHPKFLLAAGVCLLAFFLNLASTTEYLSLIPRGYHRLQIPFRVLSGYEDLKAETARDIQYTIRDQHLPDTLKKIIGQESVDVYPWNYTLIAANGLNWQPRPVINSYASYTGWLDARNSEHFSGSAAPGYMLLEYTDPTEKGYQLESIDNRFLLNDEPQATLSFYTNYEPVYKDGRFILYRKLKEVLELQSNQVGKPIRQPYSQWVDLPESSPDHLLRAKIKTRKNLPGKIKSLLYRGSIYYLFYQTADQRIISHRLIPKNAEDGVWLDPIGLIPSGTGDMARPRKILLLCYEPGMVSSDYELSFEKIAFKKGDSTLPVSKHVFGENLSGSPGQLITPGKDDQYYPNRKLNTVAGPGLSAPEILLVPPGEHTGVFSPRIDPSGIPPGCRVIRFIMTANVQTVRHTKAVMMVWAKERLTEPAIKMSWNLSYNIEADWTWTTVQHYYDLPAEQLHSHRPLLFTILNLDPKEAMKVDSYFLKVNYLE